MRAYAEVYLNDVVENQGKLFDFVSQNYPQKDTSDFINAYMSSKTRKSIDEAKAYVNTMSADELWSIFAKQIILSSKMEKRLKGLCLFGLENFTPTTSGTIICQVQSLSRKSLFLF